MFVASACPIAPSEAPKEPLAATASLHQNLPNGGLLPEGSLIEISGPQARQQVARILAENRQLPAAWIERNLESLPEEIFRTRMNFKKILFIDGDRDSAWAASSLINSQLFPIVVYCAPYENEKLLRRLRRQARESGSTVFLLRDEPCFSWTIRVHLRARNGKLEVLRWRNQ